MDLIKLSETEYEYFKLAKQIETFANRCHFYEESINRIIDLIISLNDKLKKCGYSEKGLWVPAVDISNINTRIHWEYYSVYIDLASRCHQDSDMEWIMPISLTNNSDNKTTDGDYSLPSFPIAKSACIIKVMLLDLIDESFLIEKEEEKLLSNYGDPLQSGIKGYLSSRVRKKEFEKELGNEEIASAKKTGDHENVAVLTNVYSTPFELMRGIISDKIIPQLDLILSLCNDSKNK